MHRIEQEHEPTECESRHKSQLFEQAERKHESVDLCRSRNRIRADRRPGSELLDKVPDLFRVTEKEEGQSCEFGNFHLLKSDKAACEQADHHHQDSGCMLFFLFHWMEFSFD